MSLAARECPLSPEGFHEVARDFNPGRRLHVRPSLMVLFIPPGRADFGATPQERAEWTRPLSPEGFHAVARDFNPGRPLRVRPALLVHATERSEDRQPGERGHRRLINRLRRPQFGGDGPW